MGVNSKYFSLEKINYLKDLELARHSTNDIQGNFAVDLPPDTGQVLLLGFGEEQEEEMQDFTLVIFNKYQEKDEICG
jgi:hypothetical protein